jgi:hypothetical protein
MRDAFDELLEQFGLLTIAAAIALGYSLLNVAQGASVLVLSIFTEQESSFAESSRGTLSLKVGDRILEFAQLVSGIVTLALVLAAILYVMRPDTRIEPDPPAETA